MVSPILENEKKGGSWPDGRRGEKGGEGGKDSIFSVLASGKAKSQKGDQKNGGVQTGFIEKRKGGFAH